MWCVEKGVASATSFTMIPVKRQLNSNIQRTQVGWVDLGIVGGKTTTRNGKVCGKVCWEEKKGCDGMNEEAKCSFSMIDSLMDGYRRQRSCYAQLCQQALQHLDPKLYIFITWKGKYVQRQSQKWE